MQDADLRSVLAGRGRRREAPGAGAGVLPPAAGPPRPDRDAGERIPARLHPQGGVGGSRSVNGFLAGVDHDRGQFHADRGASRGVSADGQAVGGGGEERDLGLPRRLLVDPDAQSALARDRTRLVEGGERRHFHPHILELCFGPPKGLAREGIKPPVTVDEPGMAPLKPFDGEGVGTSRGACRDERFAGIPPAAELELNGGKGALSPFRRRRPPAGRYHASREGGLHCRRTHSVGKQIDGRICGRRRRCPVPPDGRPLLPHHDRSRQDLERRGRSGAASARAAPATTRSGSREGRTTRCG